MNSLPSRLHPAELVTIGILAVVTVTIWLAIGRAPALMGQATLHSAMLVGFFVLAWWLARRPDWAWTPLLRGLAVIGVMLTLYTTLAYVAFDAIPWNADAALAAADRLLFLGRSPALMWSDAPRPFTVEALSVFYGAFIPYLYLTVLLGLVARPPAERDEFVVAFSLVYALSFLGYLFLPARGPVVALASEFSVPLAGGPFHAVILDSVAKFGGPHGAFPSLHVGATFTGVLFDLRHRNTLRGLVYLPLFALICVATIVLRYHYVVDLIAGAALATIANYLGATLVARRRIAGRTP